MFGTFELVLDSRFPYVLHKIFHSFDTEHFKPKLSYDEIYISNDHDHLIDYSPGNFRILNILCHEMADVLNDEKKYKNTQVLLP